MNELKDQINLFSDEYSKFVLENRNLASMRLGVEKVIHALHQKGIRLAIVSKSSTDLIEGYLEQFGILDVFKGAIFGSDQFPALLSKPHAHPWLTAQRSLGVNRLR